MSSYDRPPFGPFAIALPARDFYAGGFVCVALPRSSVGLIQSAIEGLKYVGSWEGPNDERNLSAIQWEDIIAGLMSPVDCETIVEIVETVYKTVIVGGCDEMGGCTLPYGSIEVIEGVLSYKTCDGWVPVKGWNTGVITDPPVDEPDPIEEEDYGCNKAAGMAALFKPDLDIAIFQMNDKLPRYRARWLRRSLPQYSISNEAAALVAEEYARDEAGNYALLSDVDLEQRLRCAWSPAMLDTSTLTEDQFLAMLALTNAQFEPIQTAFINSIVKAIGYSTFSWWAAAFADETADCDCPAGAPITGSIWFTGVYVGPNGGDFVIEESEVQYSGRRIRIRAACNGGGNKEFTDLEYDFAGQQSGDYLTVRVYPLTRLPAVAPDLDIDPIAVSQWCDHRIDGTPLPILRNEFSGYVEFVMQEDVTNLPQLVDMKGWKYPVSSTGTERYEWYVEIVAINGVDLGAIGP